MEVRSLRAKYKPMRKDDQKIDADDDEINGRETAMGDRGSIHESSDDSQERFPHKRAIIGDSAG